MTCDILWYAGLLKVLRSPVFSRLKKAQCRFHTNAPPSPEVSLRLPVLKTRAAGNKKSEGSRYILHPRIWTREKETADWISHVDIKSTMVRVEALQATTPRLSQSNQNGQNPEPNHPNEEQKIRYCCEHLSETRASTSHTLKPKTHLPALPAISAPDAPGCLLAGMMCSSLP